MFFGPGQDGLHGIQPWRGLAQIGPGYGGLPDPALLGNAGVHPDRYVEHLEKLFGDGWFSHTPNHNPLTVILTTVKK